MYAKQADFFEKYLADSENTTNNSLEDSKFSLKDHKVLADRMPEDSKIDGANGVEAKDDARVVNDVEATIMGILDSSGQLTVNAKLSEFILLMSTLAKAEQRPLCLHILQKKMSKECGEFFVKEGGLKILSQWILNAGDLKNASEIKSIFKLLKSLPLWCNGTVEFENSGIISVFKKVRKEIPDLKNTIEKIHDELKSQFAVEANKQKSSTGNADNVDKTLLAISGTVSERLLADRGRVGVSYDDTNKYADKAPVKAKAPAHAPNGSSSSVNTKINPAPSSSTEEAKPPINSTSVSSELPRASFTGVASQRKVQEKETPRAALPALNVVTATSSSSAGKPEDSLMASSPMSSSSSSPKKHKIGDENGTKVPEKRQKRVIDISEIARKNNEKIEQAEIKAKIELRNQRPGKSLLKKEGKAKVKKGTGSIRWEDNEGGTLCKIKEIPNLLKDNAKRINTKDQEKQERQRERDVQTKNLRHTMQKTVEWSTPPKLKLGLSIEQLLKPPNSEEKKKLTERIDRTLEVIFDDDTFIPANPSDPETNMGVAVPPTKDYALTYPLGLEWAVPGQVQAHTSLNSFAPAPTQSQAGLAHALPPQLLVLEPELQQVLANDPERQMRMFSQDGSLNMYQVNELRQQVYGNVNGNNGNGANFQGGVHPPAAPAVRMSRFDAPPANQNQGVPVLSPPINQNQNQNQGPMGNGNQVRIPCRYFNSGQCQNGDNCPFGHFAKPDQAGAKGDQKRRRF